MGIGNTIVTIMTPQLSAGKKLLQFNISMMLHAPERVFSDLTVRMNGLLKMLCVFRRQRRIILDVWPSLKGNGILIYIHALLIRLKMRRNIKWLSEKRCRFSNS